MDTETTPYWKPETAIILRFGSHKDRADFVAGLLDGWGEGVADVRQAGDRAVCHEYDVLDVFQRGGPDFAE